MNFRDYREFLATFLIIASAAGFFYVVKPYLPKKLFPESKATTGIVMDSLMLQAMNKGNGKTNKADSLLNHGNSLLNTTHSFIQPESFDLTIIPENNLENNLPELQVLNSYTGSSFLNEFMEKLFQLETKKEGSVRIAYFGDSMIDGDLIVQDLRLSLQQKFQGKGVGFVPIMSESAAGRISIKTSTLGRWKEINFMHGNGSQVGVSGSVFFAQDSLVSARFNAGYIERCNALYSPVLYYGKNEKNAFLQITRSGIKDSTKIALQGKNLVNTINLGSGDYKNITLNFINAQQVPIYGVDFTNEYGVFVDNYGKRGNSGLPLSVLQRDRMLSFNKSLDYDLIILQYGANILSSGSKDFTWYNNKMVSVINHLKSVFPNAQVLVLGTADKGIKTAEGIRSDKYVLKLANAQQHAAFATKSGFLSLLHIMGGVNSMDAWNKHKPKYANDDYTHFSSNGSSILSDRIYNQIIDQYENYKTDRDQTLFTQKNINRTIINEDQN